MSDLFVTVSAQRNSFHDESSVRNAKAASAGRASDQDNHDGRKHIARWLFKNEGISMMYSVEHSRNL